MYRDYKNKNVEFYFVYKSLAHPQTNGFVRPTTLDERLMHVAKARGSLGTTIPWVVDSMDNDLKHAMGSRPNSEFILDPKGRIVRMRDWSSPEAVRADLTELVGKVDKPTDPRSLNMRADYGHSEVARGVVDRIRTSGRGMALKVKTDEAAHPAYVKLRAERVSENGSTKLYLGFFVDPIHSVHWNNLSGPVQIEVNGKTVTGPKVKAEADADPREFLVDLDDKGAVTITLKYVACDDDETWCRKLTQTYVVSMEVDRDAGRPRGFGGRSR